MDAKRLRTKSATWRKGQTPAGVEYYFAHKPVFKARDFKEKPLKAGSAKKIASLKPAKTTVPSRPVREKARKNG